jgi:hypothetical protein
MGAGTAAVEILKAGDQVVRPGDGEAGDGTRQRVALSHHAIGISGEADDFCGSRAGSNGSTIGFFRCGIKFGGSAIGSDGGAIEIKGEAIRN